jgi:hypothetical protein
VNFQTYPVGIASCLTASLVLFQTTVAAADAPLEFRLKTPMPISFLVLIDDCQDWSSAWPKFKGRIQADSTIGGHDWIRKLESYLPL